MTLLTGLCWLVTGVVCTLVLQLLSRTMHTHGRRLDSAELHGMASAGRLDVVGKVFEALRCESTTHEQKIYALDRDVADLARKVGIKRYQE
jgi:hypothetical protein